MNLTVFSEQNIYIFILPGFITVWSFRYFANSNKKGDFEFLILAFIWGFLNLIISGLLIKIGFLKDFTLDNLITDVIIFSFLGFFFGLFGAQISKWNWFRNIIDFLKSNWFKSK
jgi:RsiW-degrading membrane proteinase PrsW (M82 family)